MNSNRASRSTNLRALAAIALTGAGSALVVGFRTEEAPADSAATGAGSGPAAVTSTVSRSSDARTSGSGTANSGGSATNSGAAATNSGAAATTGRSASPSTGVGGSITYAAGTWTGAAVREPWGTFQVQVTVSGGRITNAAVVASPSDSRSTRINSQAVPILTRATIASQAANVDMVSGATWTSRSYRTSLQAALDQAKA
jgi:uncharacterized protein with FMN-binding domain